MTRDIDPLVRALDSTTGSQDDVYTLLAAWNESIEAALDHSGDRFRQVMREYLPRVLEIVDGAATNGTIDWEFLHDCTDAYPPGVGDHYCSSVLANVVARCVIRTRITDGVDAIPSWALEYLYGISRSDDGDWAAESSAAFGWGVGHTDVAVLDRIVERVETGEEGWGMDVLQHVTFVDPDAGLTLLERLLGSPDIIEDLLFVDMLEVPLEQDFPDFPQYWEPRTELDHEVTVTAEQRERLLAILGANIDPNRLRHFDDSYTFDLQRAADEYGTERGD